MTPNQGRKFDKKFRSSGKKIIIKKSLIFSAIATRKMKEIGKPIKSFSIGLDKNAPDLIAARKMAKFLGTDHYEFYFSVEVFI